MTPLAVSQTVAAERQAMTQYYRTDVLRLSWRELWRIAPTFRVFLRGAILRCVNLRSAPRWAIAHDALRFIEPQTIPDDATNRLKSVVDAGAPLGFRPSVWSTLDTIGPVAGYSVAMLDRSGAMYVGGAWVRLAFRTPPREELAFSVVSKLADGQFIMTASSRKRLDKPSGFQVLNLPGQGFCEIVKKHQEQLSEIRGESIVRLDDVSLRETIREATSRFQEFNVQRGLWSPLSEKEVAAIVSRQQGGGAQGPGTRP
jgi:hypothetical protein